MSWKQLLIPVRLPLQETNGLLATDNSFRLFSGTSASVKFMYDTCRDFLCVNFVYDDTDGRVSGSCLAVEIKLLDPAAGFVIARSGLIHNPGVDYYYPLYRDQLLLEAISSYDYVRSHMWDYVAEYNFYAEVFCRDNIRRSSRRDWQRVMGTLRPHESFLQVGGAASKVFQFQQGPEGTQVVEVDGAYIDSLTRESEYFDKHIQTHNQGGKVTMDADIDASEFEFLVALVHHGTDVYLSTGTERRLHACCREMLVLANKLLCHKTATLCAQTIVWTTGRDTVFTDIHLLATHYNHPTLKLTVISEMAEKIRKLQPERKDLELLGICQAFPEVGMCMLSKLTTPS